MRPQKLLQMTFICCICTFSAHSAFALSQLGQNPFYRPMDSVEEMKNMLLDNRDDVQAGLRKAGYPELYEPMMSQLIDAEVETVQYEPGQAFPWMFYRKDGQGDVRVDKEVVWEGDEAFSSWDFSVDHDGQRYLFTVPPPCGNLTLVGVGPVPAVAEPAPAPVVPSEEPETVVPQEEPQIAARRFPFLLDAGYLYQLDPGHYFLARVGMEFPITEQFSVIPMIGGALQYSGEDGDDALLLDIFANYSFNPFYASVGLGGWISSGDSDLDSEDDDLDLIINVGSRIFGEPDGFNTSIFFEARSGIDELDDFDLYGRVGAGLRFRF